MQACSPPALLAQHCPARNWQPGAQTLCQDTRSFSCADAVVPTIHDTYAKSPEINYQQDADQSDLSKGIIASADHCPTGKCAPADSVHCQVGCAILLLESFSVLYEHRIEFPRRAAHLFARQQFAPSYLNRPDRI